MSTINNETYARFITGSDYEDNIWNNNRKVTISAGAGNDTIENTGTFWADNDIYKYGRNGDNSSIDGGTGDDFIINGSDMSVLLGGDGNDTIDNWGGAGAYDYYGYAGRAVTIDGGAGDDSIKNDGINVTINGGDGKDIIENNRMNALIYGDAGNDTIVNSNGGTNSVLIGGDGNDSI